jgi:2-iminoacetate synthase
LTLEESSVLLLARRSSQITKILDAARRVKDAIYGSRVVLFAPLYISNFCVNQCLYCAFQAGNKLVHRKYLTIDEIKKEVAWLLEHGHKRILMVAGEAPPTGQKLVDYYTEAIRAIYSVSVGPHKIRRVNINAAPLSVPEFRKLKKAGIGTYQIFQETYHDATYHRVHPAGPKSDPDNRLDAVDRAFRAGIDDVGIGVLYGLYDWRFETLGLLMHVAHLEKAHGVGPHTISVPRIEPALGAPFTQHLPHAVSDTDFKRLVAVLRLSVPYTGIILSTRETPALRDELFTLGISQVSAASRTSPGGYASSEQGQEESQFCLSDTRDLNGVIGALLSKGLMPSFCAACYRKERTGEAFMDLAKPGTIKGKCQMNALITLKEYLDDFATAAVRRKGYRMIEKCRRTLDPRTRQRLTHFFRDIEKGIRDAYV